MLLGKSTLCTKLESTNIADVENFFWRFHVSRSPWDRRSSYCCSNPEQLSWVVLVAGKKGLNWKCLFFLGPPFPDQVESADFVNCDKHYKIEISLKTLYTSTINQQLRYFLKHTLM